MALQLCIDQVDTGALLGGDYEFRPYVAVSVSWGAHPDDRAARVLYTLQATDNNVLLPPVPHASRLRGDERVLIQMFAHTRHSGFADIDTDEGQFVARVVPVAETTVELLALLKHGTDGVTVPLVSGVLRRELKNKNLDVAGATKGHVTLRVCNLDDAHRQSLVTQLEEATTRASDGRIVLYKKGTAWKHAKRTALNLLRTHYNAAFGNNASQWPVSDVRAQNLHLSRYRSLAGELPPVAFFLHDAGVRPVVWSSNGQHHLRAPMDDGIDVTTEQLLAAMLVAGARRYGMTTRQFVDAIETVHGAPRDAKSQDVLTEAYFTACAVIVHTASSVAQAAHYTMDIRFPSRRTVKITTRVPVGDLNDALGPAMGVESFDTGLIVTITTAADCEDTANVISTILRIISRGRLLPERPKRHGHVERGWASPVLAAARMVARTRIVLDTAALVTHAFAKTKGDDTHVSHGPPIRDTPADRDATVLAHCHGMWVPLVLFVTWYKRGNGGDTIDRLVHTLLDGDTDVLADWQRYARILVLEGTGAVDPFVLPAGEVAAHGVPGTSATMAAKSVARRKFLSKTTRALRNAVNAEQMSSLDAVPENARQRTSVFYRGVSHAATAELAPIDGRYAQVGFINTATRQRYDDIDDVLRDTGEPDGTVALYTPYANISPDQWRRVIDAYTGACLNQLPESAFLRAPTTTNPRTDDFRARVRHDVSGPVPSASVSPGGVHHLGAALAAIGRPLASLRRDMSLGNGVRHGNDTVVPSEVLVPARDAHLIDGASARADVAVARLHARPWQLRDPRVAMRINKVLDEAHARGDLVAYEWTFHVGLPHTLNAPDNVTPTAMYLLTVLVPVRDGK